MKKNITLLVLLIAFISLVAYSQASNLKMASYPHNSKFNYCELIQQDRYFVDDANTTTFLNFGSKPIYQNRFEESSHIKLQKDGVDALNYMGENDWEIFAKNTREITNGVEIVYMLRKKNNKGKIHSQVTKLKS